MALVLSVVVLVLQLGLVLSTGRPGYGTLAVGASAVWAATRALQALAALRQWPPDGLPGRRGQSRPDAGP